MSHLFLQPDVNNLKTIFSKCILEFIYLLYIGASCSVENELNIKFCMLICVPNFSINT